MSAPDPPERVHAVPFMALVKHLARAYPSAAAIGGLGPARQETLRFVHDVRPIFHASDVSRLRVGVKDGRTIVELTTTFVGLVGAVSPLAHYFTEDVLRGDAIDDPALRDFYDLFHHRLVSLLVRAHLRASPASALRLAADDTVTRRSLAAAGLTSKANSGSLTPRQWLGCARVLGRRPNTRDALEAALAQGFPELAFRVTDFLPRIVARRAADAPRFGARPVVLARTQRIGRAVRQHAGLVRLTAGPVDRATFAGLLPGGAEHRRLRAILGDVLGSTLDAELEVEIASGDEPRARLGSQFGARLGRSAIALRARRAAPVRARVSLTGDEAGARPVFLVSRV